ncbi:MAG: HD-GYP domain-containing protein [Devosia sp.]
MRAQSVKLQGVPSDTAAIDTISASYDLNPAILARLANMQSQDHTTFRNSQAVSALMMGFARQLGMDSQTVQILGLSGLLHDIGKTELSIDILDKPGALTADEMTEVKSHPARGHAILAQSGGLPNAVLDICLHHHERLDGTGYPLGLKDAEISLPARMATICDVYDALVSPRPYKRAWSTQQASAWMLKTEGFFDRHLLRQFLSDIPSI